MTRARQADDMRRLGSPPGPRPSEEGFSLVELLIALTVTVVVSGAMFALVAGGNNAFRREPELTDRQQNIRVALDLITRDMAAAGVDMGAWVQAFSAFDSGVPLDGAGPLAPGGGNADHLEVFGSNGECPAIAVDSVNPSGNIVRLQAKMPACYQPMPALVFFTWSGGYQVGFACDPPGGGGSADQLTFPPGQAPGVNWPGAGDLPPNSGPPEFDPPLGTMMGKLNVVRYEIAPEADGTPSLWRSTIGRAPINGTCGVGGGGGGGAGGGFRVVARGIEDLQVLYTMADARQASSPDLVAAGNYATLVREVQVTLVARVMKRRLQGETGGAASTGSFVRASLTSSVTPRAVLATLRSAPPGGAVAAWE